MNQRIANDLSSKDETLRDIITKIDLPEIESTQNLFHDLMSCIIEQQIHYRSSKKIFEKLLAKSELAILTVDNFDVFDEKALPTIKLSAQKIETIALTLQFFQENQLDWEKMKDDEIRKTLKAIKGIGDNSIDLILLFTLGRENIFPVNDYHIKKIMTKLYHLEDKKLKANMLNISENWSPHQSFATRYLLAWKELNF